MDAKSAPTGAWNSAHSHHLHLPQDPHEKTGARAERTDECREFVTFSRSLTLTRARYAALIVVSDPDGVTSPVTRAIIESADPRLTAAANPLQAWLEPVREAVPCPCCSPGGAGTGHLRGITGRRRHFAGCTNWNGGAGCDYTQPSCSACGTGMLVEAPGGLFECSDPSCRSKQPGGYCRPPRPMAVRRQKRTEKRFWGCWRYGEADACGRTRPIG